MPIPKDKERVFDLQIPTSLLVFGKSKTSPTSEDVASSLAQSPLIIVALATLTKKTASKEDCNIRG